MITASDGDTLFFNMSPPKNYEALRARVARFSYPKLFNQGRLSVQPETSHGLCLHATNAGVKRSWVTYILGLEYCNSSCEVSLSINYHTFFSKTNYGKYVLVGLFRYAPPPPPPPPANRCGPLPNRDTSRYSESTCRVLLSSTPSESNARV